MQVLAKGIEQRGARIERQPMLGSVNPKHEVEGSGPGASGLRGSFGDEPRHELSSHKGTAGDHGHLQKLAPGHIGAGKHRTV
jgi:hypothetical protein